MILPRLGPGPEAVRRAGGWALAAGLLLCGALAGCAAPGVKGGPSDRGYESPFAHALPEADPSAHGTVQGPRLLGETEQVAVRLGRAPDGRVVLLQILTPGLTPQQEAALRRAFEAGEWRRETPVAPQAESWIENLVRAR
jgi:hypothetical protein